MSDYLQPDFYRFNEDSLKLVRLVKEKLTVCSSILDLGAGCGVIGIELSIHYNADLLSLIELQDEFHPFIQQNCQSFLKNLKFEIFTASFGSWTPVTKYDLVVCNPPYYLPQSGQPSIDERRGRARSFIYEDWEVLIQCIDRSLDDQGRAFLVIKNNSKILQTARKAMGKYEFKINEEEVDDLIIFELMRLNIDGNHLRS
jgi:tRNA1Val (adenine37-N6)-methyltransferase